MSSVAANSREIYARLLRFVRAYWRIFGLSLLAMVLLATTEWMLPALLKPLLDEDFEAAAPTGAMATPLLLVLLFAVRGVLSFVSHVALNWVAQRTIADLRALMFERMLNLPASFFDARPAGELISKYTFDVTQVAQAATRVLTVMVKDSTVIMVLLAYLFYLNAKLSALLILLAPVIGIIVWRVSKVMREMSKRLQSSIGDINRVAEEAVRGYREIKLFGALDSEQQRFASAIHGARKYQMKVVRASAAAVPLIQFFVAIGIAVMVSLALREAATGMTKGTFVAFVTGTALLLPPIKRLTGVNEFLQRGLAAAESVFTLADAQAEENSGPRLRETVHGELSFRDVSLAYGDKHALAHIDLEVAAGERIALVGASGGGKTSLVSLVPRFYEPTTGQILIDGVPVQSFDLDHLRDNISWVGQRTVLFNDSIYNNIAFGGQRGATREAVMQAAMRAKVLDFAEELENGLETSIGDDGVRLSGGQRQRVAIARALLKDAPILILDEATAALDHESERAVQGALLELSEGRTSLIIAHRMNTITSADRIIVIDQGRIVEAGTHETLLTANGVYARLHHAGLQGAA
ncbi:MAG: lipid A export permease/ATP-binding protein MsbA [Pseudomonadota bacterium]